MFSLSATEGFLRTSRKFFRRHPDLKSRFEDIIEILKNKPGHNELKLHALKGDLKGLHAIRLSYKYRITLIIRLKEKEITLLDIGSHDQVYG